jgi:pseudouridine kinase
LDKKSSPSIFSFYNKQEVNNVQKDNNNEELKNKVIVLGGSAVDFEVKVVDGKFELYQSCKGAWKTSFGGVGRNIAEVSSRLGAKTTFVTALGGDNTSEDLRNHIVSYGIDLFDVKDEKLNAPTYLGVLDNNNDAIIGISDMEVNCGLTFEKIYEKFFKNE